jgi:polar amino acid transport system substrate-binding protein
MINVVPHQRFFPQKEEKMKRHMVVVLMLSLVLSLLAGCGPAEQNEWEQIEDEGVIVVGTSADYPPFEYIDENGNFAGFDVVLMEEVADRLGVEVEWQDIAFDGLIGSLQSNKIDAAIAAMSATAERDEQVDFSINYYVGKDAVLVAAGSDLTIGAKEDLEGLNVGVQTGTIQDDWITENLTEATVSRYERAEQAVADLQAGRIDAVAMDFFAATAFTEQGGVQMALETNFADEHMAIAIPEGATALKERLDEVITEMQDEGFIDQLVVEYLVEK